MSSGKAMKANIFAAGAVLWRPNPSDPARIQVALVHRPKYDDWSFPKGKLDPGETAIVAAIREVEEESGYRSQLGRSLGKITYPVMGHQKIKRVDYWAARVVSGEFVPNDEIDELRWVDSETAFDQLSYPIDRTVLRRFRSLPVDTTTVLLVRHAKAGSRKQHDGDDRLRPLDSAGTAQSEALVAQLRAFGADTVTAADRLRCVQTVEPLAERLGVEITVEPALTEEDYARDPQLGRKRALEIARRGGSPVICSQGKVIPDLVRWWSERDSVSVPASRNRKGSTWVLSLFGDRLVAIDHIESALPAPPR